MHKTDGEFGQYIKFDHDGMYVLAVEMVLIVVVMIGVVCIVLVMMVKMEVMAVLVIEVVMVMGVEQRGRTYREERKGKNRKVESN